MRGSARLLALLPATTSSPGQSSSQPPALEPRWSLPIRAGTKPSKADSRTSRSETRVLPPLSQPGQGFGETEVFQFEIVDGVPIVLYCCGPIWLHQDRLDAGERGGVYSLPVAADLSDVDFNRAVLFDAPGLYASRLVKSADGWNLIGFWDAPDGTFVGELSDPIPVTADPVRGLIRR